MQDTTAPASFPSPHKTINSMTETLRRLPEMTGELRDEALIKLTDAFVHLLIGMSGGSAVEIYRGFFLRGLAGVAELGDPELHASALEAAVKELAPHRTLENPGGMQ